MGLTAYLASVQGSPQSASSAVVNTVLSDLLQWGAALGHFIAPVVQIALIVMILIAAAERFGFTQEKRLWGGFAALGAASNVQAFIAVAIIGGLVFGMFGGLLSSEATKDLKDLALVVVGFYFGTRRRQGEVEEAVAARMGSANQPPPDAQPSSAGPPQAAQ